MKSYGRDSNIDRALGRFKIGQVVFVDSTAHLNGDWDVGSFCLFYSARHDGSKQVDLPWKRRSPAIAGYLGHRTPEVQVNMIGTIFFHNHAHSFSGVDRIYRIQLECARDFSGIVFDATHGFWMPSN